MQDELEHPNAHGGFRAGIFALWCAASLGYLAYRTTTIDPAAQIYSIIFLLAEVHAHLSVLLFAIISWRLREVRPQKLTDAPRTDVFIPTKGEPLNVLTRTISAAMALQGPKIVWVLDDANRTEVRALAQTLGANYLARGESADAKAGNLNFGLKQSDAPFVAVLDADFVASPDMLTQMLGYFRDEKCALVQAPQAFSNGGSYQHVPGLGLPPGWNEQSVWFDVLERGRAELNATAYCGCPAILRRSALDAVGGFATGTITEDAHTGLRLHKAGFRCEYHPTIVARGLAPDTATAFMRQRMRWASGQYSVLWRERFWSARLSFAQRLCYFASLQYFAGALRDLIFVLSPILALFTGILPFYADTDVFLPLFLTQLFLSWAVMVSFSRGVWRVLPALHFDAAVLGPHLISLLTAPMPAKRAFFVTPKDGRNREDWRLLALPAVISILNASAIAYGVNAAQTQAFPPLQGTPLMFVVAWAAFACLSHFSVIAKVFVPSPRNTP